MKLSFSSQMKCILIFIVIAGLAGTSSATLISFQELGFLPGGSYTEAYGVSPDGSVVVGTSGSPPGGLQAFRWEGGVMTGLGVLSAGDISEASGASNNGVVIVGSSMSSPQQGEAFRWEGVMSGLGTLGGVNSSASGVSNNGLVVVGSSASPSYPMEAFRWEMGVMTGLGVLPGAIGSEAIDVSANGLVVAGSSGPSPADMQAFRWEGDVMTPLGFLPGDSRSLASAISADGLVVVGGSDYGNPYVEAFRWEAGVMTSLGYLPGMDGSAALNVSGDGSVVVGECFNALGGPEASEAFIWDAFFGMRSVEDVLTGLGLDLTGWSLESCTAISDDGLTLAGNGLDPTGAPGAWVATIPEPTTMCLLGLGGVLLLRKRRV